jgi:hypothetical protein
MNTRSIRNRLLRIERKIQPPGDGFTLEELCRASWRDARQQFLKMAHGTSLSLFVRQFESEDLERGGADRHVRRSE